MALSASTLVKPSILRAFLQAVDPTTLTGDRSTTDAWHQFLINQTATDGGLLDLERAWLHSEGAAGETLSELWSNYLGGLGFSSGSLALRMRQYFNSSAPTVTFRLLGEDGSGILLEGSGALLLE
jgi:hypothetical protein